MHNNGKTSIKKQSRRCTEDVPITTEPPPKKNKRGKKGNLKQQ